ncbi:DUF1013 domain-containing protein [Ponticaulis profundi]|uniref:DUF1013 domain-containing protein n=1 Tax=Ponticaulis profundi TaxID=2665222 RepID=A0ABW1S709_9PROT
MANILMPKATAVWLIDNTTLTFDQIADFCGLHHLEVKGIADGEVAQSMRGADPVASGELSRLEIERAEKDPKYMMKATQHKLDASIPQPKRKGARYTPISRRQDRPNAIAWFLFHHKEVTDAQISKLIGTTKATINSVRDRSHWNSQNIKPVDPVTLGLCSQIELDALISKASEKRRKMEAEKEASLEGPGLAPLEEAPAPDAEYDDYEERKRQDQITAENLFNLD